MLTEIPGPVRHLYVHIPFCPTKCPYCAFVTHVGSLKMVPDYLAALRREMDRLSALNRPGRLATIYLGGGTPSMLEPQDIQRIIEHAAMRFGLEPGPEITLEAHPATVDEERLRGYAEAGITRLSVGGESLSTVDLIAAGRRHTPARVLDVVGEARRTGLQSVSVDLMYGLPGQTTRSWEESLQRLLAVEPDHVSLYPLSIEPRTVFARLARTGRLPLPAEGAVVDMYHSACHMLRAHGYDHYEVANWAKPGHRSRHNLAYWHNREFYAVGVGAHGYLHPHRTENIPQTRRYIDALTRGDSPVQHIETIDENIAVGETVILGLRLLQDGLEVAVLGDRFGPVARDKIASQIAALSGTGLLQVHEGRAYLPEKNVPIANEIWDRFVGLTTSAAA